MATGQAVAANAGEDGPLYRVAVDVERDEQLAAEVAEWDATVADGLEVGRAPRA